MLWRRLFIRKRSVNDHSHHHHAPEPALIRGEVLNGQIDIIDTPLGERMRFSSNLKLAADELFVHINRDTGIESLALMKSPEDESMYLSAVAPDEPHEFSAALVLGDSIQPQDQAEFSVTEPGHHAHDHHHDEHDHAHLDDEAHARAHASTLPEYARNGERPTLAQIITFGAAGGMIPCPASVTVMLLALSTGKAGLGVFTVLGFSLGLAIALVGVGVIIVTGLSKLSETGRLSWITKRAPVVSAMLVIVSGLFALFFAHKP
jgi:nickel/cobalt exporter